MTTHIVITRADCLDGFAEECWHFVDGFSFRGVSFGSIRDVGAIEALWHESLMQRVSCGTLSELALVTPELCAPITASERFELLLAVDAFLAPKVRTDKADSEFEAYQFGDDLRVVSHSNWDTTDPLDYTKLVYFIDADKPGADSQRISFHVRFLPDGNGTTVDDAYGLLMSNGADIGARGTVASESIPPGPAPTEAMYKSEAPDDPEVSFSVMVDHDTTVGDFPTLELARSEGKKLCDAESIPASFAIYDIQGGFLEDIVRTDKATLSDQWAAFNRRHKP